jgi:hypothetical protein
MSETVDTKNRLIDSKLGKGMRIALGATALYALSHEATNVMGVNPFEVGPAAIASVLHPESPTDSSIVTGEHQVSTFADQIKSGNVAAGSVEHLAPIQQSSAVQAAEK